MAERRMFSRTVTESDAFLDLPHSAQVLYFHLCMEADDEGFVNSVKKITRTSRCKDKDIKALIEGNFLNLYDTGTVSIADWLINNQIRKDRITPSKCEAEKSQTYVTETGKYVCQPNDNQVSTNCQPNVRLDKYRLDKDRLDKNRKTVGEFANVLLSDEEIEKLVDKLGQEEYDRIVTNLDTYIQTRGKNPYKSHYATILQWHRKNKDKEPEQTEDPYKDLNLTDFNV